MFFLAPRTFFFFFFFTRIAGFMAYVHVHHTI